MYLVQGLEFITGVSWVLGPWSQVRPLSAFQQVPVPATVACANPRVCGVDQPASGGRLCHQLKTKKKKPMLLAPAANPPHWRASAHHPPSTLKMAPADHALDVRKAIAIAIRQATGGTGAAASDARQHARQCPEQQQPSYHPAGSLLHAQRRATCLVPAAAVEQQRSPAVELCASPLVFIGAASCFVYAGAVAVAHPEPDSEPVRVRSNHDRYRHQHSTHVGSCRNHDGRDQPPPAETSTVIVTSTTTAKVSPTSTTSSTHTPTPVSGGSGGGGGLSSSGKVAVGVVVPIAAIAILAVIALFWWRKRKARLESEEERRKEVEDYSYNPNADPTIPAVGLVGGAAAGGADNGYEMREDASGGYRGWGSTTAGGSVGRKASTTLSNPAAFSDATTARGPLDGQHDGTSSQEGEILGAMGPSAANNRADVRRGPSNASSSYSATGRSEGSDGGLYGGGPAAYYDQYSQGAYGDGGAVIRDNPARRNTQIENTSHFPQQSAGIAQNF
ncbi:hypothetical protein A9K55_009180 [Cordyceps militaris]|uniref:Uncharacterized protein n=1 Tax=Cordyceps militaris TaxID=73501 RepID=A0A2H4SGU0_CORMI|nr:hypothetical protein A9K55_009180 [Cordyceps militaris]